MVTTIDLLDTDDESSPARLPTSRPNPSHNNNNHQATRNTATGTNAVAGPSNTGVRQSGGTGRNSNSGFATSKGKQKEKEKVVTEITLSSDDDDGDDVDERNRTVRRPPTSRVGRNGIEEITLDSGSESDSPRSPPEPRPPRPPPTSQSLLEQARASNRRASDIAQQGTSQSQTTPRASTSQIQPRRQLSSSPIVFNETEPSLATPIARRAPVPSTSTQPKAASPIIMPQPHLAPSDPISPPESGSNKQTQLSAARKGKGRAVDQDEEEDAEFEPAVNLADQNRTDARPAPSSSSSSPRPGCRSASSPANDNAAQGLSMPVNRVNTRSPSLPPRPPPTTSKSASASSAPSRSLPPKPDAPVPITLQHPLPAKPTASTSVSPNKPSSSTSTSSHTHLPPRPITTSLNTTAVLNLPTKPSSPVIKSNASPQKPLNAEGSPSTQHRHPRPQPSAPVYLSSSSEPGDSDPDQDSDSDLEIVSSTPAAVRPNAQAAETAREKELRELETERQRLEGRRDILREKEREKKVREEREERENQARLEEERLEKERVHAEKVAKDRLDQERVEAQEFERKRLEAEKLEGERIDLEIREVNRLARERKEREQAETDRIENERLEKEKREQENLERERLEEERAEKETLEKERLEIEAKAREEMERMKEVQKENKRIEREQLKAERTEAKRIEAERAAAEQVETERVEAEYEEREMERVLRETSEFGRELAEEVQEQRYDCLDAIISAEGYDNSQEYLEKVEKAEMALADFFPEQEWTQEGYDQARAESKIPSSDDEEEEEPDTEMVERGAQSEERRKEDSEDHRAGVQAEPVHATPAGLAPSPPAFVSPQIRGFAEDEEESDQEANVPNPPRPTGFAQSDDEEEAGPSNEAKLNEVTQDNLRRDENTTVDGSEPDTRVKSVILNAGLERDDRAVSQDQSPNAPISAAQPQSNSDQTTTNKKPKSARKSKQARKSTGGARGQPVDNPRRASKSTTGGRPHAPLFQASNLSHSSRQSSPDPLSLSLDAEDLTPFDGLPSKREAQVGQRDIQGRFKRPRRKDSDRVAGKDSVESGTTTPTSQGGRGTKLALESKEEDGSAQQIVAPLPLGDADTTNLETALEAKEREQAFKLEQQLLPPHQRQIGGPTYDLYDEFPRFLQEHVQRSEKLWRKAHPDGASPLRNGYKTLYEHMVYEANSKEFPRDLQPSIRICPLESAKPTDWSSPPFEICYTNRVVYVDGILPKQAPGCGCIGDCGDPRNRGGCACRKRQIMASKRRAGGAVRSEHQDFAYDSNGILDSRVFEMNDPIIECNSQCGCGPECINRVIGNRKAISVDIFHTGSKGWAVRNPTSYTDDPVNGNYRQRVIKRGEPLGVYAGELATTPVIAEREELVYSKTKRCYTYSLDIWTIGEDYKALAPKADADKMIISSTDAPHRPALQTAIKSTRHGKSKGKGKAKAKLPVEGPKSGATEEIKTDDDTFQSIYSVDAFSYGNWTRFANHVCQGFNVVPRAVYVDDSDITRPLWVYVARTDIQPGEEITISYFSETDPDPREVGLSARAWRDCANKLREEQPKLFRCYCDSKFCRGVMFALDDPDSEIFYNKVFF